MQKAVVKALEKLAIAGQGSSQFFNIADSVCAPEFKPEDMRENCTVGALQGDPMNLTNLVTPKQGDTLFQSIQNKSKPDALIKSSLKGVMIAMVRMNSLTITHSDSHFNNLGWQGDQLVIFDWGRGTTDLKSFKLWAGQYVDSWTPGQKAYWKSFSQHTLQFALVEEMIRSKGIKKTGAYYTLMSVWDTLGLLGPARAAGVVSEEKSLAFMDAVFVSVRAAPKELLTDKLIDVLIPALFGDPPNIHPVVAERPMPPAEVKAVSRIIPAPAAAPVRVVNNPESDATPPVDDGKKLADMKDACRKLLADDAPQKGGKQIASGAYAVVSYAENPSDDKIWEEYPVPLEDARKKSMMKLIQKYKAVVRVVCTGEPEYIIHKTLKTWTRAESPYLNPFIKMHMNLWAADGVYAVGNPKPYDKFAKCGSDEWYGFVTRYQVRDIGYFKREDSPDVWLKRNVKPLCDLLRTLLHIDGRFVHYDLHQNNAAIMRDGTAVLHDFGEARIRDYLQRDSFYAVTHPSSVNQLIFRNAFTTLYLEGHTGGFRKLEIFQQYYFIARSFETVHQTIEEKIEDWFKTSSYIKYPEGADETKKKAIDMLNEQNKIKTDGFIGKDGLPRNPRRPMSLAARAGLAPIDVYVKKDELDYDSDNKCETTTNPTEQTAEYYLEPIYETRYHHLARVFDILSVLHIFGHGFGKTAADKAATELLNLIHGKHEKFKEYGMIPAASAVEVERVVNECITAACAEAGESLPIMSKDEEVKEGEAYWKAKEADPPREKAWPVATPATAPTGGADTTYLAIPPPDGTQAKTANVVHISSEKFRKDQKLIMPKELEGQGLLDDKAPNGAGRITRRRRLPQLR